MQEEERGVGEVLAFAPLDDQAGGIVRRDESVHGGTERPDGKVRGHAESRVLVTAGPHVMQSGDLLPEPVGKPRHLAETRLVQLLVVDLLRGDPEIVGEHEPPGQGLEKC